jgi:tetratricopeptide (TPR) repeat protein
LAFGFFIIISVWIFSKFQNHRRNLALGWTLFLIFLFPYLKIQQFGDDNLVNDRYMYLPLVGLCLSIFPVIFDELVWKNQTAKKINWGFVFLALISWMVMLRNQLFIWKDPATMWEVFAEREPNSKKAQCSVMAAYAKIGAFEKVLNIDPTCLTQPEDFGNRAFALINLKKTGQAIEIINAGLQFYPEHPLLMYNLALALSDLNQVTEALAALSTAEDKLSEVRPSVQLAISYEQALGLYKIGQYEKAEAKLIPVLQKISNESEIFYLQGLVQHKLKKYPEAVKQFQKAVELNDNHFEALNELGVIALENSRKDWAIEFFKRSLKANPNYEPAMKNLDGLNR